MSYTLSTPLLHAAATHTAAAHSAHCSYTCHKHSTQCTHTHHTHTLPPDITHVPAWSDLCGLGPQDSPRLAGDMRSLWSTPGTEVPTEEHVSLLCHSPAVQPCTGYTQLSPPQPTPLYTGHLMIEGQLVVMGWAKTWNQQVIRLQEHLLALI